ncbi:Predicted transcription regulator, contains HTH domain, MarR family [Tistlia consotensis]|uniref:Predicted transcription regulator, contains HTH domain, MarR family n=1 Tax=Tistlia consotensis USBA 355 TaxID=560819 RepID=A0A1Y6CLD8_9PROT|nr:winged helix DNA-binding protein [Tistlia consotensis]SMF71804.1 Predicted transcription regulator, contains HTH domain, MarR family [Tistlia consotensis USBA 355]SNS06225.1 Predicted transcription regulator, contains HTH domain, MarR family [Tistlia consotensis]
MASRKAGPATAEAAGAPGAALYGPIVSSAHLAAGGSPALSEAEFGLILSIRAFERWVVRCMAAAGEPNLSPLEVIMLNVVRHRDRPKPAADIALILDIEEAHVAAYALKKLQKAGLVAIRRNGKEKLVEATERGIAACERYAAVREQLLVKGLRSSGPSEATLSEVGEALRALSGYYNQAARSAATI